MISALVLYLNKKLYCTLLKFMFNQRKPCFYQAIHLLLMHSVLLLLYFLSFSLYFTCTYTGFATKLTSSAVTRIQKFLIWKNVLLPLEYNARVLDADSRVWMFMMHWRIQKILSWGLDVLKTLI